MKCIVSFNSEKTFSPLSLIKDKSTSVQSSFNKFPQNLSFLFHLCFLMSLVLFPSKNKKKKIWSFFQQLVLIKEFLFLFLFVILSSVILFVFYPYCLVPGVSWKNHPNLLNSFSFLLFFFFSRTFHIFHYLSCHFLPLCIFLFVSDFCYLVSYAVIFASLSIQFSFFL